MEYSYLFGTKKFYELTKYNLVLNSFGVWYIGHCSIIATVFYFGEEFITLVQMT